MKNEKVIRTQSPLKAWFLTRFCGLRVRAVYATPIIPVLGAVVYSRCWVLVTSTPVQSTLTHL